MTRVDFEALVLADVCSALAFYGDISPALAARFARELDAAVKRIGFMPQAMRAGVRRCLLRRFPYSVIYRTGFDRLRVLAVMHHRQHPGAWQARL